MCWKLRLLPFCFIKTLKYSVSSRCLFALFEVAGGTFWFFQTVFSISPFLCTLVHSRTTETMWRCLHPPPDPSALESLRERGGGASVTQVIAQRSKLLPSTPVVGCSIAQRRFLHQNWDQLVIFGSILNGESVSVYRNVSLCRESFH